MILSDEKVSVVVVTYKRIDYLKLTLASILNQSHQNLEIIVVADGHQEDVEEYVKECDDFRLTYLFVEHCGYPAKARNFGISSVSGNYIAFCDDDDIWVREKIEKQMLVFASNRRLSLCCTNRVNIDSEGVRIDKGALKFYPEKSTLRSLLLTNYVSYSSVMINKSILQQTGVFPDDIKFKAVEDYHLWIRISILGEIFCLDEDLLLYRIHTSNITSKFSVGLKKVIKVFKDIFQTYHVNFTDRYLAFFLVRLKILFYVMREAIIKS